MLLLSGKLTVQYSISAEADSSSCSPGIPRILWKPKVHHRIHKRPTRARITSQTVSPRPPLFISFFKIDFNIILPSTFMSW
jgi:hypothetical protein